jgi:hypothetical protein
MLLEMKIIARYVWSEAMVKDNMEGQLGLKNLY